MGKHSIPADSVFPQLEQIVDEQRFVPTLQQALQTLGAGVRVRHSKVRRIYYRPDRSCRVLLECDLQDAAGVVRQQLYFGVLGRDGDPPALAARAGEIARAASHNAPVVVSIPSLRLVLWPYPHDPDLPSLAALADPARVLPWLRQDPKRCGLPPDAAVESLETSNVRYVPGQRCGFRCHVHWRDGDGRRHVHRVFAKAYPPGHGEAAAAVLRQIESTAAVRRGDLRVPHVYGFDGERGILWQEFVSGTKLSKVQGAEGLLRNVAAAGRALAAFQSSSLALGPGRDLESQIADLHRARAALAESYPAHREACARITDRLLALAPDLPAVPRAPVHGSFKSSHLFDDGGRLFLIDFDGAGLGDPIYDVGRFLSRVVAGGTNTHPTAETIHATVESFRTSYRRGVPWGWPEMRVRWSTCAHLIGSHVYKSVKRASSERVAATLRAAAEWLPAGANETTDASAA